MLISRECVVFSVIFPLSVLANWKKKDENEVLRVTRRPPVNTPKPVAAPPDGWPRLVVAAPAHPASSVRPVTSSADGDRYPSAPIHGHHWPFDRDSVPTRHPVSGSYSVEGTFLWAVGLFGTVENGAVVLTMLCSRGAGRPLNVLVGFLSAADLYIAMIYIPSYTYFMLEEGINATRQTPNAKQQQQQQQQQQSISFCHVSRWIFLEAASVALSLKTLVAAYLFVFTRSRKLAARLFSARNVFCAVACCWLGNAAICFLPRLLGAGSLDLFPEMFACGGRAPDGGGPAPASSTFRIVYREAALSFHLLQLAVICVSFAKVHDAIRTGRTISLSRQDHDHDKPATYLRATKATSAIFVSLAFFWDHDHDKPATYLRATKATSAIFVSLAFFWIPGYFLSILDPWYQFLPQDLHRTAFDLLLTKSAANPLIYIYGLRSLRHEIKLFCMCRCRSDRHMGTMFRPSSSTSAWSNDVQQQTGLEKEKEARCVDLDAKRKSNFE